MADHQSPEHEEIEERRGRIYADVIGSMLRELLAEQASVRLQVSGGSMSPSIRSGDLVTIEPRSAAPIRVGDVVAVQNGSGKLVVHRVVRITGDHYLTRGDAATKADPPVTSDEVLGLVTAVVRKGRQVWLGHGPERGLVAILSRSGLLLLLLKPFRWIIKSLRSHFWSL